MADVQAPSFINPPHMAEGGNLACSPRFRWQGAALTNGDVIIFGKVPSGALVKDVMMVNTASSASTTMKIGFRNADGTTTSPDNGDATFQAPADDFWIAATSIASAARTRAGAPGTVANGKGFSLRCNKDIYIIGTLGGANIATNTLIEVQVDYIVEGPK